MNNCGYVAIWGDKREEVYADSSYAAQKKAQELFQKGTRKKVRGYDIAIVLCEKDGKQVVHTADF